MIATQTQTWHKSSKDTTLVIQSTRLLILLRQAPKEPGRSVSVCKGSHDCCPTFYYTVERFTFDFIKDDPHATSPLFSCVHHFMSASLCLLDEGGRCIFSTAAAMQTASRPLTNMARSVFSLALIVNIVTR